MRHRDPPYYAAQADESLREAYCQTLLAAHPHPAVRAILYEGVPEVAAALTRIRRANNYQQPAGHADFAAYTMFFWDDAGKGNPANIIVTPRAFGMAESDLRESISIHEYLHAADFMTGIELPDGTVVDHRNARTIRAGLRTILLETRAYSHEILDKLDAIARGTHDEMVDGAAEMLCRYIDYLEDEMEDPTPLEQKVRGYCARRIYETFEETNALP